MMKRREFITLLGGAAAWPLARGRSSLPSISSCRAQRLKLASFWGSLTCNWKD